VLGVGVADEGALLTPDEFERVVARTELRERARRMAYAILVEGVSAGVAAAREGVSRQAAHKAAQAVRRRAALWEMMRPGQGKTAAYADRSRANIPHAAAHKARSDNGLRARDRTPPKREVTGSNPVRGAT
jgi:transposase